ncbi:golgi reassembly stacking protein [Ophiocordyceps camponoti-floridani]|uniref:Golgi reassembly stacking protein n=1 Tax=Ophiocordyceps camponoti-floridani TaxID=2030778 RepID=A0A8H4Q6W7_9HYPO|nr:golgi reassembly stacking protein [Ophiocordyceps camponoti-floridani]
MFNALNRFMSRLDGGDSNTRQHERGSFGFQVLRNTNLELAIEPWFDFIVGINGRPLDDSNPSLFAREIRNCAGGTVTLGLWNAKGQRTREMHVPVPSESASIGLSLQFAPLAIAANVWHVLDVAANSPADHAALLPYSDYILGSPEGALHGEAALGELVEDHIARPLRLYVYNNEYDVTREVTIQPSRDWGGEGALGCVLGYGALHRLPAPLSEPVHGPGETLFDGDVSEKSQAVFETAVPPPPPPPPSGEGDYLIPAQMVDSTAAGAPPRTSAAKKKERHGHAPNSLMDDYFKEGGAKSRELDNAPKSTNTSVPPPPKTARAPPKSEATAEPAEAATEPGVKGGGGE